MPGPLGMPRPPCMPHLPCPTHPASSTHPACPRSLSALPALYWLHYASHRKAACALDETDPCVYPLPGSSHLSHKCTHICSHINTQTQDVLFIFPVHLTSMGTRTRFIYWRSGKVMAENQPWAELWKVLSNGLGRVIWVGLLATHLISWPWHK